MTERKKLEPLWSLEADEFWNRLRGLLATEMSLIAMQRPTALLTIDEAAALCKCSTRHIRRLRTLGLPVVMLGDSVRFEADAVVQWLRARSESALP